MRVPHVCSIQSFPRVNALSPYTQTFSASTTTGLLSSLPCSSSSRRMFHRSTSSRRAAPAPARSPWPIRCLCCGENFEIRQRGEVERRRSIRTTQYNVILPKSKEVGFEKANSRTCKTLCERNEILHIFTVWDEEDSASDKQARGTIVSNKFKVLLLTAGCTLKLTGVAEGNQLSLWS